MIRQNGGGSGGSGVQHLTGTTIDMWTVKIDGFVGSPDDIGIISMFNDVSLTAGSSSYLTRMIIDIENKFAIGYVDNREIYTTVWNVPLDLQSGALVIGVDSPFNFTGTYKVNIYMK